MSDPNRRKRGHKDSDWSVREVSVLKSMWGTADSLSAISQRIARSLNAIQAKATKLDLGPFATLSSKTRISAPPGPSWAERQRQHMLLVRNLRHRQALGFADAVTLRTSSSPIGAPLRMIEPATATLIPELPRQENVMRESAKDMIYDAVFAESNGGLGYVFACIGVVVAVGLFVAGQPVGGEVATLASILLALIARSNMRRADALYARAVAAELAEGDDPAQMAEAA